MKKSFIIIILFISTNALFSQEYYFGATAGYGKWNTNYSPTLKYASNEYRDRMVLMSFIAEYKPVKPAFLYYNSGLTIQNCYSDNDKMCFIKIPLGSDLFIGGKNKLIFGVGIYGQFLINKSSVPYNDEFSSFQYGLYSDIGFIFFLTDKLRLIVKAQTATDLTTFRKYYVTSYFGSSFLIDDYLYSCSLNVGLKYKINSKTDSKSKESETPGLEYQ